MNFESLIDSPRLMSNQNMKETSSTQCTLIILSDLHLGRGRYLQNGEANILEDFDEDRRFIELIDYYSKGKFENSSVHLVLNGDIFNLIQIDRDGAFSHIIDEEYSLYALERIIQGHSGFFSALKRFIKGKNKWITFTIGNHDANLIFPSVQDKLIQTLYPAISESEIHSELQFFPPVQIVENIQILGVYIEHGHRFEVINSVPKGQELMDGPKGLPIMNLPWGSLFCVGVLPQLKKDRPFIDKVRPIKKYVTWCLLHDSVFFWRMFTLVTRYLWEHRNNQYMRQSKGFWHTLRLLKQITVYPTYERKARNVFRKMPHIHTVIMGHTHVQEWRRFPGRKFYLNTGTWNKAPSIDAGLSPGMEKLTYAEVVIQCDEQEPLDLAQQLIKSGTLKSAAIKSWKGMWQPYEEEVYHVL